MTVFSSRMQLQTIGEILFRYARLPFSSDIFPGTVIEAVIAHVHSGEILKTYDFVDVIKREQHCGWQVKSTKASTPVTWKRAKIPDRNLRIRESEDSERGLQRLGDAIINFCNAHVAESLSRYDLEKIGYARLIVHENNEVNPSGLFGQFLGLL